MAPCSGYKVRSPLVAVVQIENGTHTRKMGERRLRSLPAFDGLIAAGTPVHGDRGRLGPLLSEQIMQPGTETSFVFWPVAQRRMFDQPTRMPAERTPFRNGSFLDVSHAPRVVETNNTFLPALESASVRPTQFLHNQKLRCVGPKQVNKLTNCGGVRHRRDLEEAADSRGRVDQREQEVAATWR